LNSSLSMIVVGEGCTITPKFSSPVTRSILFRSSGFTQTYFLSSFGTGSTSGFIWPGTQTTKDSGTIQSATPFLRPHFQAPCDLFFAGAYSRVGSLPPGSVTGYYLSTDLLVYRGSSSVITQSSLTYHGQNASNYQASNTQTFGNIRAGDLVFLRLNSQSIGNYFSNIFVQLYFW
jgi:hypothetical protein